MTAAPAGPALPGPVSAIRLSYSCEQGWGDTGEDEPEIWHVSADLYDSERDTNVGQVGDFEFYRANPYVTRDLFGVLDGFDGDAGVIAEAILDPGTGHFRDDLDDIVNGLGSSMLLLNSAQLTRPWRGFGIGAVLAGKAIARLGTGSRGAACYPSPLDRAAITDDASRDKAVAALQQTWSQLGFGPFRDGVFVLDLGSTALGKALPHLIDVAEALPQQDHDEWEYGLTDEA
jgi:GNAT superfamily N-acetyltransferase